MMKEKVVTKESKPGKNGIIAMAKAGAKKKKRGITGKSADFRSRFLEKLRVRRQEVEEALKRLIDSQKEYDGLLSADDFIEDLDHAKREILAQTHYSLLERKDKELKKIEILIRRILEDEDFGRCEECGKRIPEERLLIVPEASRCVPCQRGMEKWDLRGSLAEISSSSSRRKRTSRWENREDFDDEEKLTFWPDIESISLMDLGETDFEDPNGERNKK